MPDNNHSQSHLHQLANKETELTNQTSYKPGGDRSSFEANHQTGHSGNPLLVNTRSTSNSSSGSITDCTVCELGPSGPPANSGIKPLTNGSSLFGFSPPLGQQSTHNMLQQSRFCNYAFGVNATQLASSAVEAIVAETNSAKPTPSNSPVVFGELVILGYNGCLPQGEKGRRRSKYQLVRRLTSNGIKKSKHYSVKQPQSSKAIQDKEQHSISFTLSRSQAIIVEYQHDDETDLFQIGRSSESPIDFVVIDTMIMDPNRFNIDSGPKVVQQSTISRFACRILIDRKAPHCARIYAAGFDSSKNIFLGEKATKWQTNGEIDGLTTNGILIMHPKKPFIGKMSSTEVATKRHTGGVWREVSVCGEIYSVRETRSASQKGVRIDCETNVLQDGTLIDLCGATLMWRSADGLMLSPTKRHLEEMIDQLNASRPQCPVGLNTLVIPRKSASLGAADDKQPYVYLNCGHVQGYHDWGQNKHSNTRTCPMCFKSGPIVKLTMGIEPSFCTSTGSPNYCFNPCGHMASESTTKYWSQVLIPHGTNGFHAMCPFCATPLQGDTGFVKLIFQ